MIKVDQLHNQFEWGAPDVPQPPPATNPMPPPQHPPNYYAPRRSISTITGPNRRDVDAFYQNNFPHKMNGGANVDHPQEYQPQQPQQRPSIMSGQSHQSQHLPTKNYNYEPLRFSPPNVTPPPQISTNMEGNRKNRVRFDDLPNYPTPNNYIPPRKCSLAPNFFSNTHPPQSHHMYPDQYTPRTWQHNEFMPNHHIHLYHANHQHAPPHPDWRNQQIINGNHNQIPNMRKHSHRVDIKLEHVDNPFGNPSHDMMDVTSGQLSSVKSEMLSPIKMELLDTPKPQQQSSPSFLSTLLKQKEQLQHKKSHHNVPSRKASIMALKSQLRTPRGNPLNISSASGNELLPYTPPPILAPMRNGSGLFCQIAKSVNSSLPTTEPSADAPSCSSNGTNGEMKNPLNGQKKSEDGDGPSRKNGFFYMAQQINQTNFANELEALRKESWASTSSGDEKMQTERKESMEAIRKASCMSDSYYDIEEGPKISDPNPHINLGKNYQARVKKWCDREVTKDELESITERDDILFSSDILQDIDQEQINAFELLACSQACPRAGRNKELALHLLMENKGNIEAAVEDLLRSDTLDWEHYSIVYGSLYNDTATWTPDEVALFQDAIYKSEKDFRVVAAELTGKTVRDCVQFYYTWKKDCPDDYRKLRNLRRKRQLLDINLQKNQLEDQMEPPKKKMSLETDSDNESTATDTSFVGNGLMEFRDRAFTSPMMASPRDDVLLGLSPSPKDMFGIQKHYQPSAPRTHHIPSASASKKGAQPSADGFFHCRLCDKCFEKVKSLNAHMKSHAMKARAEQEAKAHDAQIAAAAAQLTNAVGNAVGNTVSSSPLNPFGNGHLGISIPSTIGSLTPQQLTPQQLNINQQLQSQLNSLSSLSSQLNSPLTPQQQLQQFTQQQQQLVARAMQQNLFQPVTSTPLVQSTHPLIPAGLHSIN